MVHGLLSFVAVKTQSKKSFFPESLLATSADQEALGLRVQDCCESGCSRFHCSVPTRIFFQSNIIRFLIYDSLVVIVLQSQLKPQIKKINE